MAVPPMETYTKYKCPYCDNWQKVIKGAADDTDFEELMAHIYACTSKRINPEDVDDIYDWTAVCL